MRKIAEVRYQESTVNVFLWSNGDGYAVQPGQNMKEQDFDTEREVVEFCRGQGEATGVSVYEPSRDGASIAEALIPSGFYNILPDGPGLYI